MKAKTFRIISLPIIGVLTAATVAANVACNYFSDVITSAFFSSTPLDPAAREAGETLATQIEEEGIVMVKNDPVTAGGNTLSLPLAESVNKVNVFGWSSTQWIMGGSGSGRAVDNNNNNALTPNTGLLEALTNAGISYNTELTKMYTDYQSTRPFSTNTLGTHDYESCRLYEPDINGSNYTDALLSNAKDYSDTALVVLGRISGESNDCPTVQYKNYTASGTVPAANTDTTRTYLDISTEEEDLLAYVGENYENVIVIINSTNAMNLSFMDEIDGLDSCLIVGGTGNNAANAIPEILYGKVSPSGKTVDTYAYDFSTNASFAYTGMAGTSQYTNSTSSMYPLTTTNRNVGSSDNKYPGVSYLDYVEGIYVGYKWYETADAEGYWDNKGGYDNIVQYPFGYGLTYTTFEWDIMEVTPERNATLSKDDEITVKVMVTNKGDVAAQEVVEMYYTAPYTKGGIEKSAINLCAFAKTPTAVEPGESQVVTLTFNVSDMASYDMDGVGTNVSDTDDADTDGADTNVAGTYVLEKGSYEIKLMTDAHNIASTRTGDPVIKYNVGADILYGNDDAKGTNVHNRFTGKNAMDGIPLDGDGEIEYLSRADFEGTFPNEKAAARAMTQAMIDTNLYTQADITAWDAAWAKEHKDATMPTTGADNGLKVYDTEKSSSYAGSLVNELGLRLGNDYDDPEWDSLLDQLSLNEMKQLVLHGYIGERAIASIGKPATNSVDGPAQSGSFNVLDSGTGYPMPTVLAQTWNADLARSFGLAVGAESVNMGREGWYAPGVNLHRSAFGGRNYEYYSEDSYLSGIMCTKTVQGAKDVGVYTYIKHFIGYDQESYRDSLYCWMTEQTLREIYLLPFQMAVNGGATGLMTSYGRIGAVWSGGSYALLTGILREEWGFKGAVLSDYADHQNFMNGDQMLRAGGDLWMDGAGNDGKFIDETETVAFVTALRTAAKHVIYMGLNTAAVAAEYDPSQDGIQIIAGSQPVVWWPWALAGADVVIGLICVIWFIAAVRKKDPILDLEGKVDVGSGSASASDDIELLAEAAKRIRALEEHDTAKAKAKEAKNDYKDAKKELKDLKKGK